MIIDNRIEAIKQMRAMAHRVNIEQNMNTGAWEIRSVGCGLKEAKDFVEAVMAFGAQEARKDAHIDALRLRNSIQAVLNEFNDDVRF